MKRSAIAGITGSGEKGSAIVMALIAIAVVAALALGYTDVYTSTRKAQTKLNFLNTVAQIQMNIRNVVNDPASWASTVGDTNYNGTCPGAGEAARGFRLWPPVADYSDPAKALYDGKNPSDGYTLEGRRCTGYSAQGSATCPIHLDLSWSCSAGVTSISTKFYFTPDASTDVGPVNEANYLTGTFIREPAELVSSCSGLVPADVATACSSPPSGTGYQIYCTSDGWRCGRIYFE